MKRRDFLAGFSMLAAPLAHAAPSRPVVGLVEGGSAGFVEELKRLGWIDGKNIRLVDPPEGRLPPTQERIDRLVRMPVDLMITSTDMGLHRAAKATRTIPIVALLHHPVEEGYAKALSRPGGNVTGFTTLYADAVAKCLLLLRQAAPRVGTIAIPWGGERATAIVEPEKLVSLSSPELPAVKDVVQKLGLRLVDTPIPLAAFATADMGMIATSVAAAVRLGADAMLVPPLTFMGRADSAGRFHHISLRHRLPTIHMHLAAESGGLLAYGVNMASVWAKLAYYADKVLRGSKPADLPIEQSVNRELHVNLKTAAQLGLSIPQALLLQADRVFE